jgi:hypothetical protein
MKSSEALQQKPEKLIQEQEQLTLPQQAQQEVVEVNQREVPV